MRMRFASLLLLLALVAGSAAHAASVRLQLGADDWVDVSGEFNLTFAVSTHLSRIFEVGARFGGFVTSSPTEGGVPLDLDLRLLPRRTPIYAELLAGPWFLFEHDPVHAHVAFGFGYRGGGLELGVEVGYLDPKPIFGLRVGFEL